MTGENDNDASDFIKLTKAVREGLRAELRRTGVTASMLLSEADHVPDGLTPRAIKRWMNGLIARAPADHVAYVRQQWSAMPDSPAAASKRGKRYQISAGGWIEVTEDMARHLRAEFARTNTRFATLLDGLEHVPKGLTARIIQGWLYRHAATTRAAHWAFVVDRLASLPDHTAPLPPLRRQRKGGQVEK